LELSSRRRNVKAEIPLPPQEVNAAFVGGIFPESKIAIELEYEVDNKQIVAVSILSRRGLGEVETWG
jgi:hypothetical protein